MTNNIILLLSYRQSNTRTKSCSTKTLTILQNFLIQNASVSIFMLVIFYPYKFNLGQSKRFFWFDNIFNATHHRSHINPFSNISLYTKWKNTSWWFSRDPLGNHKGNFWCDKPNETLNLTPLRLQGPQFFENFLPFNLFASS